MKNIKKPIHKSSLEVYNCDIITPDEYNRIDYSLIVTKTLTNKDDYRIIFDVCKLEKTLIINNYFDKSEFIDCIFLNCDLSNNTFFSCTFIRCEFINCKLTGSHFVESYLENVLITGSMSDFLDVSNTKVKLVKIENTSLKDSNWFENTVVSIDFDNNNFDQSTFYETSLKDVSMSSSNISRLTIDLRSIKGLEIADYQASTFCNLLGLKVM